MRSFSIRSLIAAAVVGCAALGCAEDNSSPKPDSKIDTQATRVVRKMLDYLGGLESVRFNSQMTMKMEGEGINTKVTTRTTVAFKRPNKLSVVVTEGQFGLTTVSDGKQITTYMPALKKYMVQDAPERLDGAHVEGLGMAMFPGADIVLQAMLREDAYDHVMEGVTAAEHLGTEQIDGKPCHHLKFSQEEFDWEAWIEEGDRPVLRRFSPDMTKTLGESGTPFGKNMKMEFSLTYSDWEPNVAFSDEVFVFDLPEGAEKTDSLFEATEDQGPHPLVGKPAPALDVELLDGKQVTLEELKGKVVILDFWATWCGPCVKAMPTITEVAKQYEPKGVVFFAVNVQEDEDTVREFLKKQELEITVAMDSDGAVGERYQAEAIPQTVLIGKDGTVQVVHVGLVPGLKQKLSNELDALLKGENLAEKALEKAKKEDTEKPVENDFGAERVWNLAGQWAAVAADQDGHAFAVSTRGEAVQLDSSGKVSEKFKVTGEAAILRTANLVKGGDPELISFSSWGRAVSAHDSEGKLLWKYSLGQGVDDVNVGDLDGDGLDEVVVGYNGGTGLHARTPQGDLLWKFTGIGNVWHVDVGDVDGDDKNEVVTTSAQGQVHVFDSAGKKIKDIDAGCYAHMVRIATATQNSKIDRIVVGGSDSGVIKRVPFSDDQSDADWSLAADKHLLSAEASHTQPWLAASSRSGEVQVIDSEKGELIARITVRGRPQLAWLDVAGSKPLLLIATGSSLSAYRMTGE